MHPTAGASWSDSVSEADWIRERLAPFGSCVTSVVPAGFEAYARVLHPAEEPGTGSRVVRWAEVAAWSGLPLRPDAQFHSVALPPRRPAGEAPWSGQGPRQGSLFGPDAEALADVVRDWTGTPDRCWFCLWDGWGLADPAVLPAVATGQLAGPLPSGLRRGARVRLPHRDYLLYTGPAEAVTALTDPSGDGQTANLWWPADRSWCAGTEVDLSWTYVGGPAGLIARLLHEERLEVLPATPADPLVRTEDWVTGWAAGAAGSLLATGSAAISTSRGEVRAWLRRDRLRRSWRLHTEQSGENGVSGAGTAWLSARTGSELRAELLGRITQELIGLVGG